ncbi:MAG TPA: hypothetical protein VFB08_02190 [Burkholderiales bacterium]|nr:hypothetical protein [Burkholderiales bacterium]
MPRGSLSSRVEALERAKGIIGRFDVVPVIFLSVVAEEPVERLLVRAGSESRIVSRRARETADEFNVLARSVAESLLAVTDQRIVVSLPAEARHA